MDYQTLELEHNLDNAMKESETNLLFFFVFDQRSSLILTANAPYFRIHAMIRRMSLLMQWEWSQGRMILRIWLPPMVEPPPCPSQHSASFPAQSNTFLRSQTSFDTLHRSSLNFFIERDYLLNLLLTSTSA